MLTLRRPLVLRHGTAYSSALVHATCRISPRLSARFDVAATPSRRPDTASFTHERFAGNTVLINLDDRHALAASTVAEVSPEVQNVQMVAVLIITFAIILQEHIPWQLLAYSAEEGRP